MSSGFVSENEIAEKRRIRQEEWEKVRQPHQPKDAPEEEYDHRSLFDRLEEQKRKKEYEYEEAHRLKNMIRGLDDDEVDFLDLVDRSKMAEERKKACEEQREIEEFRSRVASLQEEGIDQRIQQELKQPSKINGNIKVGKTSQTKLLAGAVKKRNSESSNAAEATPSKRLKICEEDKTTTEPVTPATSAPSVYTSGALKCIGVLPGLGDYDGSSDESDCSTDFDEPGQVRYDLLGRRIQKEEEGQ